ncbi:MAG: PQQ-binding-like beta-propeller repeat protein [Planctomycetaceae bacterium]
MASESLVGYSSHHDAQTSSPIGGAQKSRHFRWKSGLFILLLGIAAGVVTWFYYAADRSQQNFAQILVVTLTMLVLTIWWTFFSGVRWRVRFAGWLVIFLIGFGVRSSVRLVGFRGEAFPILEFRWQESSEAKAAKYWEGQKLIASSVPASEIVAATPSEPAFPIDPDDWSQFRGNDRNGIVTGQDWGMIPGRGLLIPKDDDPERQPKELWRHPVGPAWSSFAVVGNRAITQEQQQESEAVVCYDLDTGEPIWVHTDNARFYEVFGGVGPRATPTIHDGRVYTLGATGILNCLELETGKPVWQANILTDAGADNITWGMSASPLIVDDMVIVNPGGKSGKGVAAYHRQTGEILWAKGDYPASYSSPILATIGGTRQILMHDGHGAAGINPEDGSELWRFPWTTQPEVNVAAPTLIYDQRVLIGSGYGVGSALLDIKYHGDQWSATTDWSQRESRFLKPKFNDFIVLGKHAYGLDEGIMVCVDLEERKQMWKKGRYGYGQLMMIGGMIIVLAESGEVVYIRPSAKEHKELYRWQAISGKTWNHPAFAHGKLLVRNAEEAACYELPIHDGEY